MTQAKTNYWKFHIIWLENLDALNLDYDAKALETLYETGCKELTTFHIVAPTENHAFMQAFANAFEEGFSIDDTQSILFPSTPEEYQKGIAKQNE